MNVPDPDNVFRAAHILLRYNQAFKLFSGSPIRARSGFTEIANYAAANYKTAATEGII